jgi:microcystin-dependent protein
MPSYIGMIIESTVLSSLTKVREIYGTDTNWISHSGYVLRGATTGVVANSATKTGGEDTHTLTINEMPSHKHNVLVDVSFHPAPGATNQAWAVKEGGTTNNAMNNTGGSQPHNNIPNYKSVYIWERIA